MYTKKQLEKAAPWIVGGLVVGSAAYWYYNQPGAAPPGLPAPTDSTQGQATQGQADPWGTDGAAQGGQASKAAESSYFGADGVANSTRVSTNPPPQGYVDQPLYSVMAAPPFLFPVKGGQFTKGFGWTRDGQTLFRAYGTISAPNGSLVVMPGPGDVLAVTQSSEGFKIQLKLHTPVHSPLNTFMVIDGLSAAYVRAPQYFLNKGATIGEVGDRPVKVYMMNEPSGWQVFDPGPWVGLRDSANVSGGLAGMPWQVPPAFGGYVNQWVLQPGGGYALVMQPTYGYGVKNWYQQGG